MVFPLIFWLCRLFGAHCHHLVPFLHQEIDCCLNLGGMERSHLQKDSHNLRQASKYSASRAGRGWGAGAAPTACVLCRQPESSGSNPEGCQPHHGPHCPHPLPQAPPGLPCTAVSDAGKPVITPPMECNHIASAVNFTDQIQREVGTRV